MTDREIIEWARNWAKASALCGDTRPSENFRRLAELAERGLAAEEWQPIATAPNDDETRVLATDGESIAVCLVVGGFAWIGGHYIRPTHWRPLPEPPKETP